MKILFLILVILLLVECRGRKQTNRKGYRNQKRVNEPEEPEEEDDVLYSLTECSLAVSEVLAESTECWSETEDKRYGDIVGFFYEEVYSCCMFVCKDNDKFYDVAVDGAVSDDCLSSVVEDLVDEEICDKMKGKAKGFSD